MGNIEVVLVSVYVHGARPTPQEWTQNKLKRLMLRVVIYAWKLKSYQFRQVKDIELWHCT